MHENDEQRTESPVVGTEGPVESPERPIGATSKAWYKKRTFYVLLAVIVVVVLVAAYFVSVMLSNANKKSTDELSAATYFKSPEILVDKVKTAASGQVLNTAISNSLGGKTVDGYNTYGVADYTVGNRQYANLPSKTTGVGYKGNAEVETANYKAFVDFFTKNKFKLVSSGKNTAGPLNYSDETVVYIANATYESKNLVCMIWHVDATSTDIGQHVASIGCADKADYEKAAKELDPFYAAYTAGYTKSTKGLVLGFPYVEDGAGGYKHAVLFVEDPSLLDGKQSEGLFYKASNENSWRFFINARGVLNCTDYNTDVLKKAFTNLPCYEGGVEKTVAA